MNPYKKSKKIEAARWLGLTLALSVLALFNPAPSGAQSNAPSGAQSGDAQPLTIGAPIARELAGGQTHSYQVTLAQGQYLEAIVEQRGIDVVVGVFAPDGKQIVEFDSPNGTQGPELVMAVAEVAGVFRLAISSFDQSAKAGGYEAKLVEVRQATQRDKDQIAAMTAFRAGRKLSAQQTKASIESAVGKFEEARRLFQATGDKRNEASLLNYLGTHLQALGQFEQAGNNYTLSLALYRSLGDRNGEARALNNLGTFYSLTGAQQQALDYFKASLPLLRAAGDQATEAYTLQNLGHVCHELAESQQALDYLNQSLSLFRAIGDRYGEAGTLNSLGAVSRASGEFQQALDYHNQALRLQRELGSRRTEAVTLHNLGTMSMTLGEHQQALAFFNQSLSIFRSVGDLMGEARAVSSVGAAWSSVGEQQKAIEYHNQALLLQRKTRDRAGEANTLANLGAAYQLSGEQQKALDYYQQVQSLRRAIGDRSGEAGTLINLGLAYEKLDRKPQALESLQQALALARTIRVPTLEAGALFYQARVNDGLGKLTDARRQLEESLQISESLRGKLLAQALRASYFASVQGSYDLYIDLLMRMDQQASDGSRVTALEASERARARSLLELLAEARADIRQGVATSLLTSEQALQRKLNIRAEAQTKLLNGKHTEAQAAAMAGELADLSKQLQEVETQIRQTSPRYAALTQPQPLNAPEIQRLLDDDTLLLEYALGEKRSYLWVVASGSITSYELAPRAEIEKATRNVYALLNARPKRGAALDPQFVAQTAALSQMLLGPAASLLGKKRLVIVAPGVLAYLPFAALPVPDNQSKTYLPQTYLPLMTAHEIINLPSASVLSAIRRETAGRKAASRTIAVLADPVFEASDPRVKSMNEKPLAIMAESSALTRSIKTINPTSTRSGLARLAFSRQEAEAIFAIVPRGAGLKATDFTASRATATSEQLSQYRMLHFATHGLLNNEQPELSGLVFSLVDEKGNAQDGFLRLHEVFNLKLNADLVVLSACETGLGKEIKGEGLIGLTRGFMYAGVPRVVASLWNVDDLATAELMKLFYRSMLQDNLRPAAALRAAQVELARQPRWAAPYFWAAFVLQGEWK